ncbi:hypothetical protein O1L60_25265 [Streptomyces diastatochromogenes]|nr:hypothetical protein [Streptomyces diastatochromogenes]
MVEEESGAVGDAGEAEDSDGGEDQLERPFFAGARSACAWRGAGAGAGAAAPRCAGSGPGGPPSA